MKPGQVCATPYGFALFTKKRGDGIRELDLPFGKLFVHEDNFYDDNGEAPASSHASMSEKNVRKTMELNEAYESLEKMRRQNLELTCQEIGIREVDHDDCSMCIIERGPPVKSPMFPRIKKIVEESKKKPQRCLTCGTPCCLKHTSTTFRAEGITVCKECEKVFHMEFIIECLTQDTKVRFQRMYHLMDLYDRTVLLLQYSNQYIEEVAKALDNIKKQRDGVIIGGASASMISGVLGVAAAFTLFTPAGPPLLITSLLFGGGASAMETGSNLHNKYFFEPNKLADRIMALHGMLMSILTVTGTLREAALVDIKHTKQFAKDSIVVQELSAAYIKNRTELLSDMMENKHTANADNLRRLKRLKKAADRNQSVTKNPRHQKTLKKSMSGDGAMVAKNARYLSRVTTGLLRSLQYAPMVGGALAAASIVVEARCMANTVQSIKDGSSCDKAQSIRRIQFFISDLPPTSDLEQECNSYLRFMEARSQEPMTEKAAVELLLQHARKKHEEAQNSNGYVFFNEMGEGKYNFRFNDDGSITIISDRKINSDWVIKPDEEETVDDASDEEIQVISHPSDCSCPFCSLSLDFQDEKSDSSSELDLRPTAAAPAAPPPPPPTSEKLQRMAPPTNSFTFRQ